MTTFTYDSLHSHLVNLILDPNLSQAERQAYVDAKAELEADQYGPKVLRQLKQTLSQLGCQQTLSQEGIDLLQDLEGRKTSPKQALQASLIGSGPGSVSNLFFK